MIKLVIVWAEFHSIGGVYFESGTIKNKTNVSDFVPINLNAQIPIFIMLLLWGQSHLTLSSITFSLFGFKMKSTAAYCKMNHFYLFLRKTIMLFLENVAIRTMKYV